MAGMKQILLMIAVVALVGCGKDKPQEGELTPEFNTENIVQGADEPPLPVGESVQMEAAEAKAAAEAKEQSAIVEKAIRSEFSLNKPTGELTKADLDKVTVLGLDNTKITNAGLKEVAKLQNLTFLNLGSTKITDAGLKELAKLQNLKGLSLDDTNITDEGAAELKKALPKCFIRH